MHSRCDLACDHCYVYRHADQSWTGRPRVMADRTVDRVAQRIAEHAAAHRLPEVHVVLHGGEPLLAGRERLRRTARRLRSALRGISRLDLRMQTNGLLLDDAFCAMLAEERILTGISLDGDRASHDRHRVRADGSGSHAETVRAVRLLGSPPYRQAFAGLLCTVDIANPPAAVYRALAELDPPRIDLLLPHATWDRPPPRGTPADAADAGTEYARWLLAVHDRWTADGRPFPIRLFDSIEAAAAGLPATTEALGLGSPDLVVVETDGEIEQADWLKTVAQGAPATGFHIDRHGFDEAAAHPGFLARATGLAGLSATCRACPVVRTCGGGLYGHRFSSAGGFDNPSVYCADLLRLIGTVQDRRGDRPAAEPAPRAHALPGPAFDELAAGHGGVRALSGLVEVQRSLRRSLLAAARTRCGDAADAAWQALAALETRAPEAVWEVMSQPYLGAWAIRALESVPDTGGGPAPDTGRLAEIALAAAVRCGARLRLPVPLRDGSVQLPLLGRLVVPTAPRGPVADLDLEARDGDLLLHPAAGAEPLPVDGPPPGMRWEPLRTVTLDGRAVPLEDTDPYRNAFRVPPRQRDPAARSERDLARWQSALDGAWRTVCDRYPMHAAGVAALPLALTPLQDPGGQGLVDTSRDCFGAIGLARPPESAALARLLVEAVQEVKLGGLLDMFDLLDRADGRPHGSPPRPPERLLRDAYVQAAHPVSPSAAADLAALAGAPLTALGHRFLAGLRATAEAAYTAQPTHPVPPAAHEAAGPGTGRS